MATYYYNPNHREVHAPMGGPDAEKYAHTWQSIINVNSMEEPVRKALSKLPCQIANIL